MNCVAGKLQIVRVSEVKYERLEKQDYKPGSGWGIFLYKNTKWKKMSFIIAVFHYGAIRQYIWCEDSGIKLGWYETLKVAAWVSEWMSGYCTLTGWFTVHVGIGQDTLCSFCIILIAD